MTINLESTSERAARWPTLVGLILVPLVIAGGFLWGTWDSDQRLGRVQAAVVNLDEAVTINSQVVPLGRQLAGGLVASDESRNFTWVLSDPEDAEAGLASGRYAAVVTIPKSFSANATSYSKEDTAAVRAATIDVRTSQVTGVADPAVGQEIAAVATRTLNTQLTESYLDNIYVGFNTLNKQFGTIADAAGKLSDGSRDLAKGLEGASKGTTSLAEGLTQLDTGADQLSRGTSQLTTGVTGLAKGLDTLADGTKALPGQTRQLADGAGDAADGAEQLASGARQLDGNLPAFTRGTQQNAAGTKTFASGLDDYADGVQQYADGAGTFAAGLKQYQRTFAGYSEDPTPLTRQVSCPTTGPNAIPSELCPVFLAGLQAGARVGAGAAAQGLADQGKTPGLLTGAQGLASGADRLSTGADQLSTGATALSKGAKQLDSGARGIATGVDGLATGAGQLSGGLNALADGTDQLADGTTQLAKGISDASDGAAQLSTGGTELAAGAKALADGTGRSAAGAEELSTGLVKLSDGGDQLADGSKKLADGLVKGQDQVPTYDSADREKLSTVVTAPVTTQDPAPGLAEVATSTLLAVVALWIGALACYVVLRAVSSRVLTSMRPSWWIAGTGLLPGVVTAVVQALALTVVLQLLLDLSAGQTVKLLGLAVLAGLAFVAVNHALVAWFGGVGRFVSVVLVVLAAAGALTSAVPELFDALQLFLPLSPALAGFRAVAGGGSGAGGAVGLLLAWLLVGVAASVLAVARRRVVSPLAMRPVVVP